MSLDLDRVPVLPVFKWLAGAGSIAEAEMLRTFNCGIGMIAVLDAASADAASEMLCGQRRDRGSPRRSRRRCRRPSASTFAGHLDLSR